MLCECDSRFSSVTIIQPSSTHMQTMICLHNQMDVSHFTISTKSCRRKSREGEPQMYRDTGCPKKPQLKCKIKAK